MSGRGAPAGPDDGSFFDARLDLPLDEAIEAVTAALSAEGFGVLTRIDLHEAFAARLGVEFRPYAILGACNPHLAHAAILRSPEVGLLLPCNVTVEEVSPARSLVRLADPRTVLGGAGPQGEGMNDLADEARERIGRVAKTLQGA